MSIQFVSVNTPSNIVAFIGGGIPVIPNHNVFTTMVDDSDYGIKDLITNMSSHRFDEIMVAKPYIDVHYDGSNVIGKLINAVDVPVSAKISLFGEIYETNITDGQFYFPVIIHESVSDKRVNVTIRVDGFPFTCIDIGGHNDILETTTYKDENGILNIIPSNSALLAGYWQSKLVDLQWSAVDLATITGILTHAMFKYVIPNMNLEFTPEEQQGLNDIQANLLPLIVTNLGTIVQNPDEKDVHYVSYVYHLQQAKQAIEKYMQDRNEIMKYFPIN